MGKLKAVVVSVLCVCVIILIALITMSPPVPQEDVGAAADAPASTEIQEPDSPAPSPEPLPEPLPEDTPEPLPESPAPVETSPPSDDAAEPSGVTPDPLLLEEELPSRGFSEPIPEDIREMMAGISMPEGATVGYDDLSYLTVFYHDFDGNRAFGNLVVANELAEEMLDIFAELYDIEYPIESVRLIDEFYDLQTEELDSLDRASMGNNNTSAFCYRAMNSAGTLSQHAYGRAIDLNPKINPYVSGTTISPANAKLYADRSGEGLTDVEKRAMLHKDDEVYKIFTSRGWKWGCEIWNGVYDYQHFQKPA